MKLHNILNVYKRDFKKIIINPMAIVIVLGLSVLPALYAWLNIYACWDVYENTGDIPVAVVNNDKGATYQDKTINIGNSVIDNLKENHKIQWHFISTYEANLGLIDSTYYAMIEIPEDFSSDFLTILSDNPVKPRIIYKADTKVNPVASKITESAQDSLVQEIISTFVSTVNEEVFSSLNSVGKYADDNKEDLLQFKDSIINVSRNMDMVTNGLDTIGTNSNNLSQFLDSISATMPFIQSGLQTLDQNNNESLDALQSAQSLMNDSIKNTNLNLTYAQNANTRIKQLCDQMNASTYSVNNAKINSTLPAMNIQLDALEKSIDATIDYLEKYNSYDYNSDLDSMISSLQNLKKNLADLKGILKQMQSQLSSASQTIDQLQKALSTIVPQLIKQLDGINNSLTTIIAQLEMLNQTLQNPSLTQLINSLKGLQTSCITLKNALEQWDYSGTQIQQSIAAINAYITSTSSQIDSVTKKIDVAIQFLKNQKVSNVEKKKQVSDIISSLKSIKPYVSDERAQLNTIQQQLSSTNAVASTILDTINHDANQIASQLNRAVQNYNDTVQDDLNNISNNLVSVTKNAHEMIIFAQNSTAQIQSMLDTAKEGSILAFDISSNINKRLSQFKDATHNLSSGLEQLDNKDIVQIISIMQNDPKAMGDFFANPFELKNEPINQIPNYGSSMAPLYTTLALWVGCLLLNAVLKTKVPYFDGIEKITLREKHFGKMLTFLTIAFVQGTIVSLGDIILLKIYTVNIPLFILFCLLSSCVFVIITYTLSSTLGNVGKAVAIVYLVFQIAGSGGSYPTQVNPTIFRILKPLFPFTYSLGGLREAVAGPLVTSVALNLIALVLFAAAFLIGGFILIKPLHGKIQSFEHNFKKSGLGE